MYWYMYMYVYPSVHVHTCMLNFPFRLEFDSHMTSMTTPTMVQEDTTSNDLLLAQMLQLEYDREHDRQLNVEERHFNKHNKGIVCTCIYLYVHVHRLVLCT